MFYFLFFCFALFFYPVSLFAGQWVQDSAADWGCGSGVDSDTVTYSGSVTLATRPVQDIQSTAADWGAGSGVNIDTSTYPGSVIGVVLSEKLLVNEKASEDTGINHDYLAGCFMQRISLPYDVSLTSAEIFMKQSGTTGGAIFSIYSTTAVIAGGTYVSPVYTLTRLASASISSGMSSSEYRWINFSTATTLLASGTYYIVVGVASMSDGFYLGYTTGNNYINGDMFNMRGYSSGGITYSLYSEYSNTDLMFRLYGASTTQCSYITQAIDFGYTPAAWGNIDAGYIDPAGTQIQFLTRSSSDGSLWDSWVAVATGTAIPSAVARYLQIASTITITGNPSSVPVLNDITVNCIQKGSFTSQFYRAFQTTDQGGWGTFTAIDYVSSGNTIDYYAVTSTSIYNLATNTPFPLTNGGAINSTVGPYIQIISSFSRTGASDIPKIDSFTVTWDDCYKLYGHVNYPDGTTPFPGATAKIECGVSTRTCVTDASGYYELMGSMGNDWQLSISSSPSVGSVSFIGSPYDYPTIGANQERDFLRAKGNPSLDWKDVGPFMGVGLNPSVGVSTTSYEFSVKYKDNENDPPKPGFPRLRIKRSGVTVQLVNMNQDTPGDWISGMPYSTSTLLAPATDYTYSFEAQDTWGADATGGPTSDTSGPVVKAKISGRLITYFGNPVSGRKVFLYHNSESQGFVTTDANGEFVFSWLSPGDNYRIVPESSTMSYFDVAEVNYSLLLGDVTRQFIRTDTVTGTIKDPWGNPLSGVQVSLSGPHTDSAATDTNGDYSFYVTTETYVIAPVHSCLLFNPSTYTLTNISIPTGGYDFVRLSRAPTLLSVGETGYQNDAVEPNNASPRDTISFKIKYLDPDDDAVKSGYPVMSILKNGATVQTLSMSYNSGSSNLTGKTFTASTMLNLSGSYDYRIRALDVFEVPAAEYTGSFAVVAEVPPVPANVSSTVKDGAGAVTGKIHLTWDCGNNGSNDLTYTLYLSEPELRSALSKSPGNYNFRVVYTGKSPDYALSSLEPGKIYYWKVRVENQYGAASESPVYSFCTIESPVKAFSYPNPFNPATGQETYFVFTMPEAGSAEVSVFSELGDLCWKRSFDGLPKGSNQISYDGKDDNGQIIYNGTYIGVVRKKYQGGESVDRCRIMVIK